jgi:SAM-dependent methyltransferase
MDEILDLEREWAARGDPGNDCWGYLPYDPRDFVRLLEAAIPVAPQPTFLEAGCGIGTKCLIAAAHGLEAHGIEIVPELAARAREFGVTVHEQDIRDFGGYGDYGIVWVNRPLRDMEAEDAFERQVREAMAPAAVLIVANTWAHPLSWIPVRDERAAWRGAWQKPLPGAAGSPDGAPLIGGSEPVLDQLIAAGVISRSVARDRPE